VSTTLAYLGLAGAILLGIAGQLVLKGGAVGAPSFIAQLLNPMTLFGVDRLYRGAQPHPRLDRFSDGRGELRGGRRPRAPAMA